MRWMLTASYTRTISEVPSFHTAPPDNLWSSIFHNIHLNLAELLKFDSIGALRGISPPIDIINKPGKGGGGENGIRIISKKECQNTVQNWLRGLGVVSGSENFERLEMLMYLDRFSQVMPGLKPKRNELLAIGQFENSKIECLASIFWEKRTFPAEMQVVMIFQSPNQIDDKVTEMMAFIRDLSRDNAILADFTPLLKPKSRELEYEILFQKPETGTQAGSGTVGGALILYVEQKLEKTLYKLRILRNPTNSSDGAFESRRQTIVFVLIQSKRITLIENLKKNVIGQRYRNDMPHYPVKTLRYLRLKLRKYRLFNQDNVPSRQSSKKKQYLSYREHLKHHQLKNLK
eukprot:gene179-308_t